MAQICFIYKDTNNIFYRFLKFDFDLANQETADINISRIFGRSDGKVESFKMSINSSIKTAFV